MEQLQRMNSLNCNLWRECWHRGGLISNAKREHAKNYVGELFAHALYLWYGWGIVSPLNCVCLTHLILCFPIGLFEDQDLYKICINGK